MNHKSNPECELCGQCLSNCPVMDLDRDRAKHEVKRLWEGDLKSPVLKACISCFACSQACPNGLDPHRQALNLWHQSRPGLKIPAHVRVCLPEQHFPNAWDRVTRYYTEGERSLYSGLTQDISGEEVLYLGCNQLLDPYLALSPLFRELRIAASPGICCGEPCFRMGFLDAFKAAAAKWLDHWSSRAPKRIVSFCPACLNMIQNVYPKHLGSGPPFEAVGVVEWLIEKSESGQLAVRRPVDMKVMVQDSCHARILGKDYRQKARKLIELSGATIVDSGEGDQGSGCCGFAGAAPSFNPLNMYKLGAARLKLAREVGAQAIAAYCNGCALMLSMAQSVSPQRVEIYHLQELLDMARGFDPPHLHRKRARQIIASGLATAAAKFVRPGSNRLALDINPESNRDD